MYQIKYSFITVHKFYTVLLELHIIVFTVYRAVLQCRIIGVSTSA